MNVYHIIFAYLLVLALLGGYAMACGGYEPIEDDQVTCEGCK